MLFAPGLMFPVDPDIDQAAEPFSSQVSDGLFRIPLWMDLSLHAVPAIVLLIGIFLPFRTKDPLSAIFLDFFFIEKRFQRPMSTIGATALAISFGSAYSLWVEHAASVNGRFPYPFMNLMNPFWRTVMYVTSTFGALMTFWGLNAVHR